MNNGEKSRIFYLDVIKILAIFMVLYNHRPTYSLAQLYIDPNVKCFFYQLLATACRCGVPLFFMASGTLLIGKDEELSVLFKKRILRILIVMVLCTLVMAAKDFSLQNVFIIFFTKLNWYLYAYFDYLLMLPFLRYMGRNCRKNEAVLFVTLSVVFYTITGVLISMGLYSGIVSFAPIFSTQFASYCWAIVFGVGGYYIQKYRETFLSVKSVLLLLLTSIISIVLSVYFVMEDYRTTGGQNTEALRVHYIVAPAYLTFIMVFYVSGKVSFLQKETVQRIIVALSGLTFGIFLIETHTDLIWIELDKINNSFLAAYMGSYWLGFVAIFVQFIICAALTAILKRVPGFRRIL